VILSRLRSHCSGAIKHFTVSVCIRREGSHVGACTICQLHVSMPVCGCIIKGMSTDAVLLTHLHCVGPMSGPIGSMPDWLLSCAFFFELLRHAGLWCGVQSV
jgi:hypothetical protein